MVFQLELSHPSVAFLVAVAIGVLIGLERERHDRDDIFAGIRTLPLVALLGAVLQAYFPFLRLYGFLLILLLVAIGYYAKISRSDDIGMTTAVATVLTYVFGAMCLYSPEGLKWAVVLAIVTATLLAQKEPLHAFAYQLESDEMKATLKFLIIALVVLPLLPDESVPYLLGLNPQFVWLMVVFVSAIGFSAYVFTRVLGPDMGIGLSGIFGGLVSSTATAFSMAHRSRENDDFSVICGVSVIIASLAMFLRMIIEVAVVNVALLGHLFAPLVMMTVLGLIPAVALWLKSPAREPGRTEFDNPFTLKPALIFGVLFGAVLLAVEYANQYYGRGGTYLTAFISGIADVDAITLSLGKLAREGEIDSRVASQGIVIASMTNTMVKAGITWVVGNRKIGGVVTMSLGLSVVGGGIWLWL